MILEVARSVVSLASSEIEAQTHNYFVPTEMTSADYGKIVIIGEL